MSTTSLSATATSLLNLHYAILGSQPTLAQLNAYAGDYNKEVAKGAKKDAAMDMVASKILESDAAVNTLMPNLSSPTALATSILGNVGITNSKIVEFISKALDGSLLGFAFPLNQAVRVVSDYVATYKTGMAADATWDADLVAAQKVVAARPVPQAVGQSFTLTTGVENRAGSGGNDLFSGFVDAANASVTTLNAGDNLDGGAGNDALNVTITGTAGTTSVAGVTVANIERIQTQNTSSATQTVDLATAKGYTTLATYGSSAAVTYSNAATLANAEMSYGSGSLTVNFSSSAVAGAADALTLALTGQTGGTFTTSGIETLTVNATTANSGSSSTQTTVTDTGLKTVIITGDKTVGLNFTDTTVTKVDGSAATGALNLNVAAATAAQAIGVTGGAGNDRITIDGANGSDTIDGGAGTDTVVFTAASGSTALTKVTNVETVAASISTTGSSTAVVVDGSIITGVTGHTVSLTDTSSAGASGITILSLDKISETATVTVSTATATGANGVLAALGADNGTELRVTPATDTATNVFGLTLSGIGNQDTNASAVLGLNTVNADLFETINVTSNTNSTGSTTANLIASLASTNAKTLNVTGAADFEITAFSAANLATIDGSAATGKLYIDAAGVKSTATITAGAGNDTIDGGTGANSITGGAGNDVLAGGGGNDVISGGDGADRIIDGSLSANGTTETINTTASVLNFSGGAGNDTFVVSAATLGSTDTITGGDDIDTLVIDNQAGSVTVALTGASTDALKNVTVERVALQGTASTDLLTLTINDAGLTQVGGSLAVTANSLNATAVQTVNASGILAASGSVTFDGSGSTNVGAIAYIGGAATDVVVGSKLDDTVSFANGIYLTAADTLNGGSGSDVLVLSSANAATLVGSQMANVKSFETINLDGATGAAATAMSVTLSEAVAAANASATTNTLTVIRTQANGPTVDDTGTTKVDGSAVTSIKLSLRGALGSDTLTGGAADDVLAGGAGIDSLTGGAGNDRFEYAATTDVSVTEVISGGDGTDTIRITSAVTSGTVDFTLATVTSIEAVDGLGSGGAAKFLSSQLAATTQITESATTATDTVINVVASSSTVDLSGFTYDSNRSAGVVVTNDGTFATFAVTVTGTSKADSITGGSNDDIITGGAGADTVVGAGGGDTINISETVNVADVVAYTAAGQTGAAVTGATTSTVTTGWDVIIGFTTTDTIATGVTLRTGAATVGTDFSNALASNVGEVVTVRGNFSNGSFTYSATGTDLAVYWDDTGTGGATSNDAVVLVGVGSLTATSAASGVITFA